MIKSRIKRGPTHRWKIFLTISLCTVFLYILFMLSRNKIAVKELTSSEYYKSIIQNIFYWNTVSSAKSVHQFDDEKSEVQTSNSNDLILDAKTTENSNFLLYTPSDVLPYDKNQHIVDLTDQSAVDSMKPEDKEDLLQRRKSGLLDGIKLRNLEHLMSFVDLPGVSCKQRKKLIILVSSFCGYRDRRDAIRQSWGKYSKSHDVQTVFFVGQCQAAFAENKETQDIVQANFVDNYFNLTLKSLTRMKWFNEFCANSDMVLMCDDDVLVDSGAILKYYPRSKNLDFFCRLDHLDTIHRDKTNKWYIPKWLLNGDYWPDYCFGFAYMINSSIITELYQSTLDLPYVYIEDTLITGISRIKAQKHIISDNRFSLNDTSLDLNCDSNSVFASHDYLSVKMIEVWNKRVEICKLSVKSEL